MVLPRGAMGLYAVCDCGISRSYSLTNFGIIAFTSMDDSSICADASETSLMISID